MDGVVCVCFEKLSRHWYGRGLVPILDEHFPMFFVRDTVICSEPRPHACGLSEQQPKAKPKTERVESLINEQEGILFCENELVDVLYEHRKLLL